MIRKKFIVIVLVALFSISLRTYSQDQEKGALETALGIFIGIKDVADIIKEVYGKNGYVITIAKVNDQTDINKSQVANRPITISSGLKYRRGGVQKCNDEPLTKDAKERPEENCHAFAWAYSDPNNALIAQDIARIDGYSVLPEEDEIRKGDTVTSSWFAYSKAEETIAMTNPPRIRRSINNKVTVTLQVRLNGIFNLNLPASGYLNVRVSNLPKSTFSSDLPSELRSELEQQFNELSPQLSNEIFFELEMMVDESATSADKAVIIRTFPSDSIVEIQGSEVNVNIEIPIQLPLDEILTISTEISGHSLASISRPKDPSLVELDNFKIISDKNNIYLKWKTLTEVNNSGFRIWRTIHDGYYNNDGSPKYNYISTLEALSNYKLINIPVTNGLSHLINAKGNDREGANYSYIDINTQRNNVTLYYLLEDVNTDGTRTFHCDQIDAVTIGQGPAIDLESAINYCKEVTGNNN